MLQRAAVLHVKETFAQRAEEPGARGWTEEKKWTWWRYPLKCCRALYVDAPWDLGPEDPFSLRTFNFKIPGLLDRQGLLK